SSPTAAPTAWRLPAPFSTTRAGPGTPPTCSALMSSTPRNTGAPAPISGRVRHLRVRAALRNGRRRLECGVHRATRLGRSGRRAKQAPVTRLTPPLFHQLRQPTVDPALRGVKRPRHRLRPAGHPFEPDELD